MSAARPPVFLGPLEGRAFVDAEGADALDYLHRMLTQDLRGLTPRRWRHACFLDVRGRILADLRVWHLGDRLRLVLDAGQAPLALAALERTVIADDVRFGPPEPVAGRLLGGAAAPGCLEAAGLTAPGPGEVASEGEGPPWVVREDRGRVPAFELLGPPASLEEPARRLEAAGAVAVDAAYLERLRVEEGVPAAGAELGPQVLFNEAGLESAITWGKGCFPGQEPVVMARHRGRPPRRLVALRIEADRLPPPGTALLLEGRPAGVLTSVVSSGAALGYLRTDLAGHPGPFGIESGGHAWPRDDALPAGA